MHSVVLFDGECNLCSGSVRFILQRDGLSRYRQLCSHRRWEVLLEIYGCVAGLQEFAGTMEVTLCLYHRTGTLA